MTGKGCECDVRKAHLCSSLILTGGCHTRSALQLSWSQVKSWSWLRHQMKQWVYYSARNNNLSLSCSMQAPASFSLPPPASCRHTLLLFHSLPRHLEHDVPCLSHIHIERNSTAHTEHNFAAHGVDECWIAPQKKSLLQTCPITPKP